MTLYLCLAGAKCITIFFFTTVRHKNRKKPVSRAARCVPLARLSCHAFSKGMRYFTILSGPGNSSTDNACNLYF